MTARTPTDPKRPERVREMFGRIVPRYDLMNRLMTGGRDRRWRALAAQAAEPQGALVLDLGAGTGDLTRAVRDAGARLAVGADFTGPMLRAAAGKTKASGAGGQIAWIQADALRLPFADGTFDAVTSAFVLRNLVDLPAALREMVRVLAPGGRLVALDITHPPPGPRGAVLGWGFRHVVTPLAGLVSGDRAAYRYLPNSLDGYPTASELVALLRAAGASEATYRPLAGGAVALHVARTPPA